MHIGPEPVEKQRDDRAQGAVLQGDDCHRPWTRGQLNRQCAKPEALLAEMKDHTQWLMISEEKRWR